MCDPVTLTVLTVAAAGVTAYGQYQQGQAAKQAGEYQAAVAEQNARTSENLAKDAEQRGQIAEQNQRRQTAALMGRQQAVLAAKGIDLANGTPLDILSQSAEYGELDALTIRHNASLEALQLRAQAGNQRAQGQLSLLEGNNAATAGTLSAGGTLLSGGAKAGGYWQQYKGTN